MQNRSAFVNASGSLASATNYTHVVNASGSLASGSSYNAFVSGAEDKWFESRAGQIGLSFVNGSLPL